MLAGIAASDAVCCAKLGRRSRAEDHHEAESLLAQVEPDGDELASGLRRLIDLKDTAQYGLIHLGRQRLRSALRQARVLVNAAAGAVRG